MVERHIDFWTASAGVAPVLGLTHSVITSALYRTTSRLYHRFGKDLSGNAEAVALRDRFARMSDISMASVAGCIISMTWALVTLGFDLDVTFARIVVIVFLTFAMTTSLVLGILTAQASPILGDLQAGETDLDE